MLPNLTLNRLLITELLEAKPSCFALGLVEIEGSTTGFLAMRPAEPIPESSTQQGFRFGHTALSIEGSPIFQFMFQFYGYKTFNSLVDPSNKIAQKVISTMIETGDYFFFAIDPNESVTAFRSEIMEEDLVGLKSNFEKFGSISSLSPKYDKAFQEFSKRPEPEGEVMEWVCRDNLDYLDMTKNRVDMTPR